MSSVSSAGARSAAVRHAMWAPVLLPSPAFAQFYGVPADPAGDFLVLCLPWIVLLVTLCGLLLLKPTRRPAARAAAWSLLSYGSVLLGCIALFALSRFTLGDGDASRLTLYLFLLAIGLIGFSGVGVLLLFVGRCLWLHRRQSKQQGVLSALR